MGGEELLIGGAAANAERWVAKLALTYVRQVQVAFGSSGVLLGLGAGASVHHVPARFDAEYGGEWPCGFVLFVSARPAQMRMAGMHEHGMRGAHAM